MRVAPSIVGDFLVRSTVEGGTGVVEVGGHFEHAHGHRLSVAVDQRIAGSPTARDRRTLPLPLLFDATVDRQHVSRLATSVGLLPLARLFGARINKFAVIRLSFHAFRKLLWTNF